MKQFKLPVLLCTISFLLFVVSGCVKENNSPVSSVSSSVNSNAKSNMVLTPVGYMPKTNVHFVGEGYELSIINNHIKKIESKTGKVVEDFGAVTTNKTIYNQTSNVVPETEALPSGWITYASWTNDTSTAPITYFTTNWKVPAAPTTNSGQTVFLFNGMQDGFAFASHIFQPVLQWGPSAAGGGFYWSVTNWYVSGANAFYGALVNVSTGTKLQGIMRATATNAGKYDYVSYFKGLPKASGLRITNAKELYWAAETLETYNCQKLTDYPPDAKVQMDAIQILKGKANAKLKWISTTASTDQHTEIVSNASPGGEVDIYFH